MVRGGKMISRVMFFICLAAVSALSVELTLGPGTVESFVEAFYSTKKRINSDKDMENVLGRTHRIMAFQKPIVDIYGVRAYFPKENVNKVKELLLSFKKTNHKRLTPPPEEGEFLSNGYVGSIILFGKFGYFLAELKYYHPNQLVTEDRTIWTSPKYNDLESMLKKMYIIVPPIKGAR